MYFTGDKMFSFPCHVQRFNNVEVHTREEKDVLCFEAAAPECKSTSCVLWPLGGSARAAQCDDAGLFLLLSKAVLRGKQREAVFSI